MPGYCRSTVPSTIDFTFAPITLQSATLGKTKALFPDGTKYLRVIGGTWTGAGVCCRGVARLPSQMRSLKSADFLMLGAAESTAPPVTASCLTLSSRRCYPIHQSNKRIWGGARLGGHRVVSGSVAFASRWVKIFSITFGSSMEALICAAPSHARQIAMSMSKARFRHCA